MKSFSRQRVLQGLVLASTFLLTGIAFAANKGSFELMHPTQVGDKELAPGTYTVHWEGSGDDLQLNILQHDKPVASVSGHIVKVETPPEYDSALVHVNPEGSRMLSQIRFRGRKFGLEVSGENGSSGNAPGAGQ